MIENVQIAAVGAAVLAVAQAVWRLIKVIRKKR
jgi:hypothetical protein